MRTKLISFNFILICLISPTLGACTDRNTKLDKMELRQLSAESRQAAIASDRKSKEIDSINQKMKVNLVEARTNLELTKKHRRDIGQ